MIECNGYIICNDIKNNRLIISYPQKFDNGTSTFKNISFTRKTELNEEELSKILSQVILYFEEREV